MFFVDLGSLMFFKHQAPKKQPAISKNYYYLEQFTTYNNLDIERTG
jgi:hypothetical protein